MHLPYYPVTDSWEDTSVAKNVFCFCAPERLPALCSPKLPYILAFSIIVLFQFLPRIY